MQLDNLDLFLERTVLTLPVGSETYEIPEVDGETFLRIVTLSRREDPPMRDDEVFPLALGQELYDQLARSLTAAQLSVVGITAYLWQLGAHDAAAAHWRSGGKARPVPAGTPTETPPETRTAEASTTRRRASSSGTSTRRKSSGSVTEPPSAGSSSSPAGT